LRVLTGEELENDRYHHPLHRPGDSAEGSHSGSLLTSFTRTTPRFDAPSNRIFSLNGDANSATVIDAAEGKFIKNLPLGGKPEYGVAVGDGKLYANLTDTSEIVEIDTKKAEVTRRWSTAPCKQPVPMAIDLTHQRLFNGCRSGVMAVSDYKAGKVVATLPIGAGVDGAGYDPATGNAFASNADGTLTIIHQDSPDTYRVLQTLTTPIGSRNMGFDPATHSLYVISAKFGPIPPGAAEALYCQGLLL
jgi:DNA-binding beta-propeller fold protein YncE